MLLGPGVTNDGNFGLVSYRGISGLYNNNTVDGADNNQAFFSEARGRTRAVYSISQAAIKEFQVGVSNFSAEFGRAAGGTVNAVTKSGTQRVPRRRLLLPARRRVPGAGSVLHRRASGTSPTRRRQQFGVGVGGPIKTGQGVLLRELRPAAAQFPPYRQHVQRDVLQRPAPRPRHCASTIAFYQRPERLNPREGNNKIVLGKVDCAISHEEQPDGAATTCTAGTRPTACRTQPVMTVASRPTARTSSRPTSRVDQLNYGPQPALAERARVQIGRDFEEQMPNGTGTGHDASPAASSFGMPNFLPRPKYPDERRYQFIDNVTWYRGAHSDEDRHRHQLRARKADQPVPGRRHLRLPEPEQHRVRLPAGRGGLRAGAPARRPAGTTPATTRRSTSTVWAGALSFPRVDLQRASSRTTGASTTGCSLNLGLR